jgi:Second Messenger Oligonucleotide or Dinucleotide Synthetase domain
VTWVGVRPRFRAFHADLNLTQGQIDDGFGKALGVRECLARAYYDYPVERPPGFMVGSWGKGTPVRPPRDVDLMVPLPWHVFRRFEQYVGNKQSTLLHEVKNHLLGTYSTTDMRGDGQVVMVRFNTVMIEVVPVFRLDSGQYLMTDTNDGGRWKTVDPFAEMSFIDQIDRNTAGNCRTLIRMLKVWKRERNVPLKSFLLEIIVADYIRARDNNAHDYYWYDYYVRDFFAFLRSRANGWAKVPGTGETILLGDEWLSGAESAHQAALQACHHECYDQTVEAGVEWQKIFGSRIAIYV